MLTVDTVSELIAGLFLTVHSNSLLSSIIIAFPNGVFDEKFTYVLLECYLEHIIADHGISVRLLYNKKETNIFTDGIGQSPYVPQRNPHSLAWILSVNLDLTLARITIVSFFSK